MPRFETKVELRTTAFLGPALLWCLAAFILAASFALVGRVPLKVLGFALLPITFGALLWRRGRYSPVTLVADREGISLNGAVVMPQLLVVVPAALFLESTTFAVNGNDPAAVGVPVMAPVDAFKLSPAGRLPVAIE